MHLRPPSAALAVLFLFVVAAPAPGDAQPSPRCQAAENRQFDFWVGEWEVSGPDGGAASHSTVTPVLDGCVIREEWDGGRVRGVSHSVYDRTSRTWRQRWMDNRGVVLDLEGGRDGDRMVMSGTRLEGDGVTRTFRITWTPSGGGGVRQVQEVSEDGGETWRVGFEGSYRPAEEGGAG